jgi:hypothetical protein
MINAINTSTNFSSKNTVVDCGKVMVFGNHIANVENKKLVSFCLCSWITRTTIRRLNALLDNGCSSYRMHLKSGKAYLRHIRTGESFLLSSTEWVTISE